MTSLAATAPCISGPARAPRQLARGRAAPADGEMPARPLRAGALGKSAIEPQRVAAGQACHRATPAPCLGLALAAGAAFWAGFGGTLALLLG
jgi:hypothetical protein